jgi:hypothetical protein
LLHFTITYIRVNDIIRLSNKTSQAIGLRRKNMRVQIKNELGIPVAAVNAKEVNGRLEVSNKVVNRILSNTVFGLNGLHTAVEIWNADKDIPAFQTR